MVNLEKYKKNYYSQNGEDGIIEKIFQILNVKSGQCVEFGAWDGKYLSNTYQLVKNKGWKGLFVEPDPKRFSDLENNLKSKDNILLRKFVKPTGKYSLDNLLSKAKFPKDFDLLSIDIDGNDYYIWEHLNKFKPKLVIIEFNSTMPLEVDYVQKYDLSVHQGSSLTSLVNLSKLKGYELIAITRNNAFFIKNIFFEKFEITDNSPEKIWSKRSETLTYLFQCMDGEIKVQGNKHLLWHDIDLAESDFQLVPKIFRHFPATPLDILGTLIHLKKWRGLANLMSTKLFFKSK